MSALTRKVQIISRILMNEARDQRHNDSDFSVFFISFIIWNSSKSSSEYLIFFDYLPTKHQNHSNSLFILPVILKYLTFLVQYAWRFWLIDEILKYIIYVSKTGLHNSIRIEVKSWYFKNQSNILQRRGVAENEVKIPDLLSCSPGSSELSLPCLTLTSDKNLGCSVTFY